MVRPIDVSQVVNSLQYLGQSRQRLADIERREKEKKSGVGAQVGGIAGAAIGSYYGGPVGGAAGGAIGSAVGAKVAGGNANTSQVAQSGYQGYQMGQDTQKSQNNQRFNTALAENIESDPKATDQQRQYAKSIKGSTQDSSATMQQGYYLGVDPKSLSQQNVYGAYNSRMVDKGISYYSEKQKAYIEKNPEYTENDPEYRENQKKIEGLNSLKSKNLGSVPPESIKLLMENEIPEETRIYPQYGKIIAETYNLVTGKKSLKSLGEDKTGDQKIYQVPYKDKDGSIKVRTTTDQKEAIKLAEEHGSGILDKGGSILLEQIKAGNKASEKDVEYGVTTDVMKRRDAITKKLTKKGVTNETISPTEEQVDAVLRDELETMSKTTTGREKAVIEKQYAAVDAKIKRREELVKEKEILDAKVKDDTTRQFISGLPELSPDLETTNANIEFIKKNGAPGGVNADEALEALKILKAQYENQVISRKKNSKKESQKAIEAGYEQSKDVSAYDIKKDKSEFYNIAETTNKEEVTQSPSDAAILPQWSTAWQKQQ